MPITVAAIAPLIGCVCSTCRGRRVKPIRRWEKTRREDVEGPNVDVFVEDLLAQPHHGEVPKKRSNLKTLG
jgi:hypothetical protein